MRLPRSLPPPAFQALRFARAGCLRLLGPADSFAQFLAGRPRLPPLWLRRHCGPIAAFESAAREMAEVLGPLDLIDPDDLVLDVGCGAGAMTVPLLRVLGPQGHYVGCDVHGPSIRWCRKRFADDRRARFERIRRGGCFAAADGAAGFVLAKSVFTHLLEPEARFLLREIRRVLAPGRVAAVTAFLFEWGEGERLCARDFPFCSAGGAARWRWKARPESGVALERARFLQMVTDAALHVVWFVPGFWPGAEQARGQDLLLLSYGEPPLRLPCPRSWSNPKTP